MSNAQKKKLRKYADRPIYFNGTLTKRPILLSDSKGNYLKGHSDLIEQFGYTIDFQCKGGARFQDQLAWLKRNLVNKIRQYGKIVLYVWLGTCDLTYKQVTYDELPQQTNRSRQIRYRKVTYIDLRHDSDSAAVAYFQSQISSYSSFLSAFPTVKVVFLEVPVYSIVEYNKHLRVPNPDSFHDNDILLRDRIAVVNDVIRQVNSCSDVQTPRFKRDLLRSRKEAGGSERSSLSFSPYKDGIHPDFDLARCWMKKIVLQMLHDCR